MLSSQDVLTSVHICPSAVICLLPPSPPLLFFFSFLSATSDACVWLVSGFQLADHPVDPNSVMGMTALALQIISSSSLKEGSALSCSAVWVGPPSVRTIFSLSANSMDGNHFTPYAQVKAGELQFM